MKRTSIGPIPSLDRARAEFLETSIAVTQARQRLHAAQQDLFEWELAHEDARRMLEMAQQAAMAERRAS